MMPFSVNLRLEEPRHFSWVILGEVAASAYPSTVEQLAWIKQQNIRHILSLSQVGKKGKHILQFGLCLFGDVRSLPDPLCGQWDL